VTAVTDIERRAVHSGPRRRRITRRPFERPVMFKSNVGTVDRIARVLLGVVLIALTLTGAIGAWGWVGVVPLLTAALGSCPLYSVLGFSTCPMKKA
jgi:fatty acid desaturase